jgi:hypothetical protein
MPVREAEELAGTIAHLLEERRKRAKNPNIPCRGVMVATWENRRSEDLTRSAGRVQAAPPAKWLLGRCADPPQARHRLVRAPGVEAVAPDHG